MTFIERLPSWLLIGRAARHARQERPAAQRATPGPHDTPVEDEGALHAGLMRRRVQHFCEEQPADLPTPARRTGS